MVTVKLILTYKTKEYQYEYVFRKTICI